jgi:sialic acid synthase SpsE/D-lyxose ketol-isomerase
MRIMAKDVHRKPLFVFELANNHMGFVEHGCRIIREMKTASEGFPAFSFAVKFQYRQLDSFIHAAFKDRKDIKHIKRFQETRLSPEQFKRMKDEADTLGFITACTPFDEASVDLIEAQGFDFIKIASCSLTDWPLLERIVKAPQPVIASTAAAPLEELDKVVSFFQHRSRPICVMHCVGTYPTPPAQYCLDRITALRDRYAQVPIGYSTHEAPSELRAVQIAIAKGAQLFEKHVAVATEQYKPNAYSATPDQVRAWLRAAADAFQMCAANNAGAATEEASLRELRRGVYVKTDVSEGTRLSLDNCFLAMPAIEGQLTASDLSKCAEMLATEKIGSGQAVLAKSVRRTDHRAQVNQIVQQVRKLLKKAQVAVSGKSDLEVSHHYGIDRFKEFGLTMVTCVNREYCKKLLVMLPGQQHPEQYHKVKEETFQLLYGDLKLRLNGVESVCAPGETVVVEREVHHAFSTAHGAIIEEISSRHVAEDSFYTDPKIQENANRKTLLTYWMS